MWLRRLVLPSVLLCALAMLDGCSEVFGQSCNLVGCVDNVSVNGTLESEHVLGEHVFELEVDGAPSRCVAKQTSTTLTVFGACDAGRSASLGPARRVIREPYGASTEIIPGKFGWGVRINEVAGTVRVRHLLDGAVLSDHTVNPAYELVEPNGHACGPACYVAAKTVE